MIVMDTNSAAVTVNAVDPLTVSELALMVAVPRPVLTDRPVLLIFATDRVSDDQVAVDVRSCVLPSVKVPMAANCRVVPSAIALASGVTAIDTSTAEVTVRVVVALTEPELAVTVAVPVATLAASPCLPGALLRFTVFGLSVLHCTDCVMSCVLLSVNVPVAVNCCVVPSGIVGTAGVTAIETNSAVVTFSVVVPLTVLKVAFTLVLPTATLCATPPASTVAMLLSPMLQFTVAVRSVVLPSVYVPVAFNPSVVPNANEELAGVIAMDSNAA